MRRDRRGRPLGGRRSDQFPVELSPEGDGTRLVLTDQLQASWAARNAAGWDDGLDRLAADPGAWPRRFAAYSAAFEPAIGPQEGPPADYKGDLTDAEPPVS